MLPALYGAEFQDQRSSPEVLPYEAAKNFSYHGKRTGALFNTFAFIIRVMCIDPHAELKTAWQELIAAKARTGAFPPQALAAFEEVGIVDYEATQGTLAKIINAKDKIKEVQLAKELSEKFRDNYRRAAELARAGK